MRIPRRLRRVVARAKPFVPERAWPYLLATASLTGDGPLLALPAFERVLVVAPHPDDETIGAGGTIALLSRAGAAVTVVFTSSGDATVGSPLEPVETAARRESECLAVARILGFAPEFLRLPDGRQGEHVPAIVSRLSALMEALRPDAVFAPWFLDGHPDHRAVAEAVARAVGDGSGPSDLEVWGYETWTALPPNRVIDVTEVVTAKTKALQAHATASLAFDVTASLGLNRWRAMQSYMGRGHAEAFLAATPARWAELVDRFRPT